MQGIEDGFGDKSRLGKVIGTDEERNWRIAGFTRPPSRRELFEERRFAGARSTIDQSDPPLGIARRNSADRPFDIGESADSADEYRSGRAVVLLGKIPQSFDIRGSGSASFTEHAKEPCATAPCMIARQRSRGPLIGALIGALVVAMRATCAVTSVDDLDACSYLQ